MADFDFTRFALCTCIAWMNLFVCVSLHRSRVFKTALGTLFKSLTCADVIFGQACLIDTFRSVLGSGPDNTTCSAVSFAINVSFCVTVTTYGYISFDRYYAILRPKTYLSVLTNRKACWFVWGSYIGSSVAFLPTLLGWEVDNNPPTSCLIFWQKYSSSDYFAVLVLAVISLLSTFLCYFYIMKYSLDQPPHSYKTGTEFFAEFERNRKIAKTFLAAMIVFYFMWFPFAVMTFMRLFTHIHMWTSVKLNNYLLNIGIGSIVIKFIIFLVWMPSFYDGFSDTLCQFMGKCLDYCIEVFKSESYIESTIPKVWNEMENSLEQHFHSIEREF